MTLNKDELPLMLNPKTGSPFYVIGEEAGFRCGLRMWLETRPDGSNQADLRFRIRVEGSVGLPPPPVFSLAASAVFSEAVWSKTGTDYVSIYGTFSTGVPLGLPEDLRGALADCGAPYQLFDYLITYLRAFNFGFNIMEFEDFFWGVVDQRLAECSTSQGIQKDKVILTTPTGTVSISSGVVEPTGTPLDEVVASL